jgi:hypothetical protein
MAVGKLGWQMNPSVRGSLQFVRGLKQLAHTYHSASDPQVRGAAQRRWDAAVSKLFCAEVEPAGRTCAPNSR